MVVEYSSYGVWLAASGDLAITDSVIRYSANNGVNVDYLNQGTLTVSGSTITNNAGNGIYDRNYSVSTISGNEISDNGNYGLHHRYGTALTVSGNIMAGNSNGNIYAYFSQPGTPVIQNNTVSGGGTGIHLSGSEYDVKGLVEGNSISGHGSGLYMDGKAVADVLNNVISGNDTGIYAYASGSFRISGNEIRDNNYGGISLYGYASPVINYNDIYGNSDYAVRNDTQFDIDARNNWWGVVNTQEIETGPNPRNLSFIYDYYDQLTSGRVNYSGWLDNEKGSGIPADTGIPGQLSFTDISGTPVESYDSGSDVFIRLTDGDLNVDPQSVETVTVLVTSSIENTGTPASSTPPLAGPSNTGDGTLTDVLVNDITTTEDWTVECTGVAENVWYDWPVGDNVDVYTFSVTGSASGVLREYEYIYGYDQGYDSVNGDLHFRMEMGNVVFAVGDSFTFSTVAAVIAGESVLLTETGADTGIFSGSIATTETDTAVSGNNVVEASPGDLLSVYYDDAAGDWGLPARVKDTAIYGATLLPGGELNSDTTWSKAESPYLVTGDITVNQGVTLTIEPGVTLLFLGNSDDQGNSSSGRTPNDSELIVYGQLVAMGTTSEPIVFTSSLQDPFIGDWGGIYFSGACCPIVQTTLQHVVVEYSSYGVWLAYYGDLAITDSVIRYSANNGVNVDYLNQGTLTVGGSTITNNAGNGIYDRNYSVSTISGNEISDNGNYGLHHRYGTALTVSGNIMAGNSNGNIYAYFSQPGTPVIQNNTVSGGGTGIHLSGSEYDVKGLVEGNSISGHGSGLYMDGKAVADVLNNVISGNDAGIYAYASREFQDQRQ